MITKLIDANSKDAEMLKRIDLSPINIGSADGNERLVADVQHHNNALRNLTERFERLAEDRKRIADADQWLGHDSKTVLAERRRVVAESWNVLVALRQLLRDRQAVLQRLWAHVANKADALEQQHTEALDRTRRALTRRHRRYLRSQPTLGPSWLEEQIHGDEAVVALRDKVTVLRRFLSTLGSLRDRPGQDAVLACRQREVYEQLN